MLQIYQKTKHPNDKAPKITKKNTNLQNVQRNKISKATKCPKLQNVQNNKMTKVTKYPKFQNVQVLKIYKVTIFWLI